jgi:hypothetical protein
VKRTSPEHQAPPIKIPRNPTPEDDIPRRISEPSLDDHLAILTRAIFQAGLSWALIAARWPAFERAFDNFAVRVVANYGEGDLARIMATDGVIHSRTKILGTIKNARALLALEDEFGSVANYAAQFGDYDALWNDARSRFAFLGDLNCYYWLFRAGLPVPPLETWMIRQEKDHPRMREMVEYGRRAGTSSEVLAQSP